MNTAPTASALPATMLASLVPDTVVAPPNTLLDISLFPALFFLSAFVAFSVWERYWPNLHYATNPVWYLRLIGLQLGGLAITNAVGWLVADHYPHDSLLNQPLAAMPAAFNGFVGYLAVTFINYWWHRLRHDSDTLWRVFHQIHHSTHRLQTAAALYSHPLDYAATVFVINLVAYGLFGFDAASAAWTTAWVGIFELWEHTNIRTPQWLGYLIVRPEMHRIHHELNRHQKNYGLPLWDMLFGTYENSQRVVACGFTGEMEDRLGDMLRFRDVHKPSS